VVDHSPKTIEHETDRHTLFVYTIVSLFDRRKAQPLPLENIWLVLDWELVPSEEAAVIHQLISQEQHDRRCNSPDLTPGQTGIVWGSRRGFVVPWRSYRKFFKQVSSEELEKMIHTGTKGRRLYQTTWSDDQYFENECGEEMKMTDALAFVTKTDRPLVLGDIDSVLRIGPTPMRCRDAWCSDAANVLAQYLDVVRQIFAVAWFREPLTISYLKENEQGKLVGQCFPELSLVRSVAPLLRQLYSTSSADNLLQRTHRMYAQFCSDEGKRIWLDYDLQQYTRFLASPPFLMQECGKSTRELLDMIMYGTKLMHATSYMNAESDLQDFFDTHTPQKAKFELHQALKGLANHSVGLFHVVRQDFEHWLKDTSIAKPTAILLGDALS
jgi:hypothetical protein